VSLLGLIVVGGSPPSDALEAENVVAAVQKAEFASIGEHHLEANSALMVVASHFLLLLWLRLLFNFTLALWMDISAALSVLAIPFEVKLADLRFMHLVLL